jgi:uncharacterized coiled-coil DUF342 family protein
LEFNVVTKLRNEEELATFSEALKVSKNLIEKTQLSNEVAELTQKRDDLMNEVDELKSEKKGLVKTVKRLENQISNLRQQTSRMER